MKVTNFDERIHVLDSESDYLSVLKNITESKAQEDPFYILDVGDIVRKYNEFKQIMPRVHPYYAVKCNDSLMVLEILAALGTGFDCASKGELNKVLSLGVEPNRIIFANPAKPSSHINYAANVGVDLMTFDNESELYKVKRLYPSARMVIRIRCDDESAQCPLGLKFGCNPETEAPRLLRLACTLGLDVAGVSFHVGSGCRNPPVFRKAIKAARDVFDYGKTLGYTMNVLDLGGGYPGDKGTSIARIAEIVNEALAEYFPENADVPVHVMAEPGRYFVASAYTLACNVHSIREIKTPDGLATSHVMYYINDGVYGSFNCLLYDHAVAMPKLLNERKCAKMYPSSIWGPTCDSLDKVVDSILLPKLEIGEWMYFENMGAYTLPVASPFNGFPVPNVHIVADEKIWYLLKDTLPLNEDHFIISSNSLSESSKESSPVPLSPEERYLMDKQKSSSNITVWNLEPIEITLPMEIPISHTNVCHETQINNHFDYINVGALQ